MIEFDRVTLTYPDARRPVLREVSLRIDEGDLCLVVGSTGSGKSTLLGAINGHVPHFTGGSLQGEVRIADRDTRTHRPRDLADLIGVVGQDPLAGFVADTVEEELAYAMEQLAVHHDVMRKRVEETLDLLGIADLRNRPLRTLSGGQQQRVAIGAALTSQPRILVLDEPTSSLDPVAAEEVLAAITRLVHDLGLTVVVAEHRIERVLQYADRVLVVPGDGQVLAGPPAEQMTISPVTPPVIDLARLAGWEPPPLSVRDARRVAAPLRDALAAHRPAPPMPAPAHPSTVLAANGIVVTYDRAVAVREVDLDLRRGQVLGLMGRNGSGKSSLLWAIQGAGRRDRGQVNVQDRDPRQLPAGQARQLVGLVPQTPADLLYLTTVADECAQADRESGAPDGACRELLERVSPGVGQSEHPADLSEGQRLALVLAIQLVAAPAVLLLDEPTRGLDYAAKARLGQVLTELAADGRSLVVATHDVEFVARFTHRVIVMAEGEIVADGPATDILTASAAFAPQVAKILAPQEWLTVGQVAAALSGRDVL
jgi:energy-coupling factor transport system ATP-binding protein